MYIDMYIYICIYVYTYNLPGGGRQRGSRADEPRVVGEKGEVLLTIVG